MNLVLHPIFWLNNENDTKYETRHFAFFTKKIARQGALLGALSALMIAIPTHVMSAVNMANAIVLGLTQA